MILHIISDDKFLDKGLINFERVSNKQNLTLIFAKTENFKYLKLKPDIILRKMLSIFSYKIIMKIRSADAIVIHCLSLPGILVALIAKKKTKILWIGWGGDYYSLFATKGYRLYGKRTKKLLELNSKPLSLFRKIKRMVFDILKRAALKKITFFSPVIYEDFELYMKYFPQSKLKYFPWNYGVSVTKNDIDMLKVQGNNILIGNSASYTNNHLEIFEIFKDVDLVGRKLIVPLSYGDETYRDEIIKIGHELFGDAFHPLIDFMPYEEYQKILQSCSIAIMNHYRQQAAGNISLMISLGAKVYLSNRNPYYRTLLKRKIKVFTIEELLDKSESLFVSLTDDEQKQNCINREKYSNQKIIDKQTSDIIVALMENE